MLGEKTPQQAGGLNKREETTIAVVGAKQKKTGKRGKMVINMVLCKQVEGGYNVRAYRHIRQGKQKK
jgi:hypothetical protein